MTNRAFSDAIFDLVEYRLQYLRHFGRHELEHDTLEPPSIFHVVPVLLRG